MEEEVKKLKQLIETSERILITSHISPDPDAICSVLLMGTTLSTNYPSKKIVMNLEELNPSLGFLKGYKSIGVEPLVTAVSQTKPQLIIMVDAMNYGRCTRGDAAKVAEKAKEMGSKLAVIDHHEPVDVADNEVYINQNSPAAAQDAYEILFQHLKYKKPEGSGETAMTGILSDSARFLYDNPRHRSTFRVVSELIDEGVSIELLENRARRYSSDQITVLGELAKNLRLSDGYTYSFISDDFTRQWIEDGKSADEFKHGCELFVSGFIRNIGDNKWGFIVYPDLTAGKGRYSASFRALGNIKDVAEIARKVGGGGHKPSAGAKYSADSVEDAVEKVKAVI